MPFSPSRARTAARLSAVAASAALALVTAASPASAATSDPLRDKQWNLDVVRAEAAWPTSTGAGAVVAVVDSGVDLDHPDLQGQLVPGITTVNCPGGAATCGDGDWVGQDGVPQEADSHGTHVAGIIAAATDNGVGVAGVAPDARIMPVKALEDGSGSFADIATGIRWSVDHGADVVNLSLGSLPGTQLLSIAGIEADVTEAVAYARDHDVLVVAAAGNETVPVCDSPSFDPGALCVTSVDRNKLPSYFSNGGIKLDAQSVAGPGGSGLTGCADDVYSTVPVGQGSDTCGYADYDSYAGTSMATPAVAGVAALLAAQGRSAANIADALMSTARTPLLGTGAFTPSYGHGVVDAPSAVAYPVG